MSDMDLESLLGSEVFRNFAQQELAKEAKIAKEKAEATKKTLSDFEAFQIKVNSDLKLKNTFKQLQARLLNDSEYRASVNEHFANGVLLLKIEE